MGSRPSPKKMALTRQQTKWQKPDINSETEKAFGVMAEMAKYLPKNEIQFPVGKYEDISENSLIPSLLFWADHDLYYTARNNEDESYVRRFWEVDLKAPHRGQYKRTEVGDIFPDILKDEHERKPGDNLVTPKQHYVPFYQDQSAPIADIHARSFVDWHQFDFALHFNNWEDYTRVNSQIWNALARANSLLAKLLVDTFIISLFGGFLHCYPVGHPLYRFFSENNDTTPDKEFSDLAEKFYKKDGEVRKRIQEISKWVGKWYKAKVGYLTNLVNHEVIGQNQEKKIPKFAECKPDLSTREKAVQAMRKWYLKTDSNSKYTEAGHMLRRTTLYSFASVIDGTLRDLTLLDAKNWCGHDFYAETKDKLGIPVRATPDRLMVFMNDEDLSEMRTRLRGSEADGVFTESFNGKIERWEKLGVTFYGLNYIPPGTAAIVDELAFKLKEYFSGDYDQFHAYDLVTSRIKHIYVKPVLFEKVVARVIMPAEGQQYAVPAYWGSKNLAFLAQHD